MKNDYLWDKTGNDSEIEKLETVLQSFRCQDSAPPEISSNVVQFKTTTDYKFPVFRAIAAAFIFGFGLIVFWFIYSGSKQEIVQTVETESSADENLLKVKNTDEFIGKHSQSISTNFDEIKPEKHFINSISKSKNPKIIARKLIYNSDFKKTESANNKQVVKLTVEEKDAYDKLMLALSITSSKLKIVSDKVQNTGEQTAINK